MVTNKHVIYNSSYSQPSPVPKIDSLTLTLHSNREDLSVNEDVQISLFDADKKRLWLEHSAPEIDVILIPVSIDEQKSVISKMDRSFIDNTDNLLVQFEKILVVGYPFGWYDDKFNLPSQGGAFV